MGAKALWRHVEGTAVAPKPYTEKDGVHLLADGKTPATDEQIEVLLTTSTRLGAKIKDLKTAEEMWTAVKDDATKKSTLHLLDAYGAQAALPTHDATS